LLFTTGIITTALFLFSLSIFVGFAIKSKTIKSFQSQISIFIGVYVIGEVMELNVIQTSIKLPADIGSQMHMLATIIITAILWSRLFYSSKSIKRLVEHDETANQKG
jgi:hypothetical protein